AGSQSVWRCVHRQSGWIGGAPVDDSGGMAGLAAGRTTRRVPDAAIGRDTGAEERLARLVDAAGAAVGSLPRRELPGRCLPRWIVVDVQCDPYVVGNLGARSASIEGLRDGGSIVCRAPRQTCRTRPDRRRTARGGTIRRAARTCRACNGPER